MPRAKLDKQVATPSCLASFYDYGQVAHTLVPLSSSGIIRHWPQSRRDNKITLHIHLKRRSHFIVEFAVKVANKIGVSKDCVRG